AAYTASHAASFLTTFWRLFHAAYTASHRSEKTSNPVVTWCARKKSQKTLFLNHIFMTNKINALC
ncbi:hypothetical protein, partial [Veronia pacifica]|uniref:hypothetical protein n=1 Tax=Veronia pacifica TaxID=1080227 RepID=UPI001C2F53FE